MKLQIKKLNPDKVKNLDKHQHKANNVNLSPLTYRI